MNTIIRIPVLAAALSLAVFSCKKDKKEDFTATDVTGTSTVSGHVSKRVISSNGAGGWTATSLRVNGANVNISISVPKSSLYPNSNAQGADVYRATTDANGNYSIPVKSNASGVTAMITVEGFNGTLDTMLVNGTIKTGQTAIFTGTTETKTLYMGQNLQYNFDFNQSPVGGTPQTLQTGTAIVTGSVSMSFIKETLTGTVTSYSSVNVPVPEGYKVYLKLSNDPGTFAPRTYEAATDVNGNFTFEVTTVQGGNTGFPQDVSVWVNDYATTRDTLRGATRVTGLPGVFQRATVNIAGVFTSSIKNATYLRYTNFVPN